MSEGRGLQRVEHSARLGGGRSARLIALAVVLLLVGFVGAVILGREPAPPPVANAPATEPPRDPSSEPSSTDGLTPSLAPEPSTSPAPAEAVDDITAATPAPDATDETLGAILEVGGSAHWARFERTSRDTSEATYRIPYPRPALEAALVLTQVSEPTGTDRMSIGSWSLSLEPLTLGWESMRTVLDVNEPPRADEVAAGLEATGYHLVATASSKLYYGILKIAVARSPAPEIREGYAIDARIGDMATRVPLEELSPGHFVATLTIADEVTADHVEFALVVLTHDRPELGVSTIYEDSLAIPPHGGSDGVRHAREGQAAGPDVPQLLTYRSEFQARSDYFGFRRTLVFDLRITLDTEPIADDGFADMSIPWPPRDYAGPFAR